MTLLSVLIASILGSVHCVSMCGGLAACAFNVSTATPRWFNVAWYNLGRLISYVLLGLVAGATGQAIGSVGTLYGIPQIATWIFGAVLIVWGVQRLILGAELFSLPFLGKAWSRLARVLLPLSASAGIAKAFLLGCINGLLPCGWLYAFVAVAAATGSPATGALTMSVFWLGNAPAVAGSALLGGWVQRVGGKTAPRLTALFLIAAGIFSLTGHVSFMHAAHAASFRQFFCAGSP